MGHLASINAVQKSVAAMVEGSAAFAGVSQDLGIPFFYQPEHFWVALTLDTEQEPVDTNLALFERRPRIGGGIAVRQYADTWEPVETRLLELVAAFEALIDADRTLGGTCTGAHVSAFSLKEQQQSSESELGLVYYYALSLRQYG